MTERPTHSELLVNDTEEEEVVDADRYQHLLYKNNNNLEECYGVSGSSASSASIMNSEAKKVLGVIGFLEFHGFL